MQETKKTGFTSLSLSKEDLAFYTDIRDSFCKQNGLDPSKISVQTVLKTGMTFYNQRRNYVKQVERDEQGRFKKDA